MNFNSFNLRIIILNSNLKAYCGKHFNYSELLQTIHNKSMKNFIGRYVLLELVILNILLFLSGCQWIRPDHPIVEITKVVPYQDVRWNDLRKIESQLDSSMIRNLIFNEKTKWPKKYKAFASSLFIKGKNPGLGIYELHKQGITGKGVTVAIMDQNICLDHPEFAGKIIEYYDAGCNLPSTSSSMHGPAVVSLLIGDSIGTAPGAKIYYVAEPSWTADAKYKADGLNWIIDKNRTLPEGEKIRTVSVSAIPSGPKTPFTKNNNLWDSAYSRAIKTGLIIIDCTLDKGILSACYYDIDNPDNIYLCKPGFPNKSQDIDSNRIFVPTSLRTVAEEFRKGRHSYIYFGHGGISWAAPYLVGVLALGWQLRPDISGQEMIRLLQMTAYQKEGGIRIIQPKAFVDSVKAYHRM